MGGDSQKDSIFTLSARVPTTVGAARLEHKSDGHGLFLAKLPWMDQRIAMVLEEKETTKRSSTRLLPPPPLEPPDLGLLTAADGILVIVGSRDVGCTTPS